MSLDAATLEKLMAFADGELEPSERAQIELLVRTNPDAARVVSELGVLGECVRVVESQRSTRTADGIADAVMSRIAAAPPMLHEPEGSRGKVISLAARRRKTYGIVAALVAAAAGVVVVARSMSPEEAPMAKAPSVTAPAPAPTETSLGAPTVVASAEPAKVESASPSNVSVILVPSEGDTASSVVIWLADDNGMGGGLK